MLVERVEPGVQSAESSPPAATKPRKRRGTLGAVRQMPLAKFAKQQLENFEFELRDAPVVDQSSLREARAVAPRTPAPPIRARAAAHS